MEFTKKELRDAEKTQQEASAVVSRRIARARRENNLERYMFYTRIADLLTGNDGLSISHLISETIHSMNGIEDEEYIFNRATLPAHHIPSTS